MSDIQEKADVVLKLFLFRKRLCFQWFLKIPKSAPSTFKTQILWKRITILYKNTKLYHSFFFLFGKRILPIFLFQSNGVSCAFISLQCLLDYSSPGVGCRKQRPKTLVNVSKFEIHSWDVCFVFRNAGF